LRYCNWRQTGDTESGAYDLTARPPRRLVGARYFLPTDDEWYKAAYFDTRANRYWLYPTCSNDLPSQDAANYEKGEAFAKGPPYYLADVDDYADTPSPWGVVQMGGNAWEYLEDTWMINGQLANKLRGGSFGYTETGLASTNTDAGKYDRRCYVFGARLAHSPDGWHPVKKPFKYVAWMKLKKFLHVLHG
jgi:formylglycine-generating enzyme required for sulfatase activity